MKDGGRRVNGETRRASNQNDVMRQRLEGNKLLRRMNKTIVNDVYTSPRYPMQTSLTSKSGRWFNSHFPLFDYLELPFRAI
jgi:hypothetical protein